MNFTRQELADQSASLMGKGVYVSTSSWEYTRPNPIHLAQCFGLHHFISKTQQPQNLQGG